MPIVRMPDGQLVRVPDNPTPQQAAQLRLMAGPIDADPVPQGTTARFLQGLDVASGDIQTAIKQRLGRVSDAEVDVRRQETSGVRGTPAGGAGYYTAKTLAPIAASLAIPSGGLLGAIVTQAGLGGLQGLMEPTGIGESATENVLMGTGAGALGGAFGHGLSRLVSPRLNPDYLAQMLEKNGSVGGSANGTKSLVGRLLSPMGLASVTGTGSYLSQGDHKEAIKHAAGAAALSFGAHKAIGSPLLNAYLQRGLFGSGVDLAPFLDPLLGQLAAQRAIQSNAQQGAPWTNEPR